ncbi:glycerophosphodiester phosphodiesterase [Promethearchaeum syntrophicum]|uniref:Glycerophosphodiester phosphodiesterase n=1 Tax=Promethearchaeum syntrophicum TaxID=2594042 RepID=A0A5B9D9N6_9ARCH|nr:glycerophosphodiester phosphodiesterase [Candidatus Prometheoarchaeum syntrophicum]QEE15919.1 cytoplasmic glycerophosphodiester phosphodiesterase [Candidatus Prometheoarchaeum syntrophicum]
MVNKKLKKKENFPIAIIAHRGFNKKYPENTMLAFRKAIEAKADYIELDVHFSADKEFVVIHNYTTGNVANQDLVVKGTHLNILKSLDIGEGEKIPTLQEVIDLCKGKIGINIEIKAEGLAESVVNMVEKNGMIDDIIISSFIHSEVAQAKKLKPEINCATLEPTGGNFFAFFLAFLNKMGFINHALSVKADSINPISIMTSKKLCTKAHVLGLLVNPWTVDKPKDWERLIKNGVDSIITNDPEGLYNFLTSKYSK